MNANSLPLRRCPAGPSAADRDARSSIVFVTVCTHERRPILCRDEAHALITDVWRRANAWQVGRYVIMPDHIHLFCAPGSAECPALSQWVAMWKSLSAAVWPDRTIQKVWQKSFWDTPLRHGDSYAVKWEYVRMNPIRKGLTWNADTWRFQGEVHPLG